MATNPDPSKKSPNDWQKLWRAEIGFAEKKRDNFLRKGRKISNRYRSEQNEVSEEGSSEFNIFWSNVETLLPATYSRRPQVEVTRRFRDDDPVGRVAGQILERAIQYEIDQDLALHEALKSAVKERLLPGMGQVWVRYEPQIGTEMVPMPNEQTLQVEEQPMEVLKDERTPVDHVFWEDFLVSPARTWSDVRWVARRVPFSKAALRERFEASYAKYGGKIADIPQDWDPAAAEAKSDKPGQDGEPEHKRTPVWEIWSKEHNQLFWICLSGECEYPLDIQPDRFQLEGFFPCPKPLLATTTTDQFLPVADYLLYQKQLIELDQVSRRIRSLTRALRLIGVYDSSQPALRDLLSGGSDTRMVPVSTWAAFAEKGGLKGVIDFLPVDVVAKVLTDLYTAREQCKQAIYEITGMSDIIRGASLASETLGAQEIKAKFANLRLSSRQQEVAEFVTRILQLKGELICERYSPETIIRISSAELLPDVAQNPETLQAALQLLKNERLRNYRIEIVSRSMVELDEVDERARRTEFMETVSNFMNAAKNVSSFDPAMMPVAIEMLKFAVRGFSVGRTLENALDQAQQQIVQKLQNPEPPQPDPTEVLKKEIETMRQEGETQRTGMNNQTQLQVEQMKLDFKSASEDLTRRHETMQGNLERLFQDHQANQSMAAQEREAARSEEAEFRKSMTERMAQPPDLAGQIQPLIDAQQQLLAKLEELLQASTRLRKRVPVYDDKGDITEVQEQFIQ